MTSSDLETTLVYQLRVTKLPAPEREFRFAPPRRFRFDFAWPDRMLAVEVDGGTWSGGRHTRGSGFARDAEKFNIAAMAGWCVLHFTGAAIEDGRAVALIKQALPFISNTSPIQKAHID